VPLRLRDSRLPTSAKPRRSASETIVRREVEALFHLAESRLPYIHEKILSAQRFCRLCKSKYWAHLRRGRRGVKVSVRMRLWIMNVKV